jgi:hypothetical protein
MHIHMHVYMFILWPQHARSHALYKKKMHIYEKKCMGYICTYICLSYGHSTRVATHSKKKK